MNKEELIIKTNELYDQNKASEGELLFDEYLDKHPYDVDVLLRLAVYVLVPPLSYYPKSLECIYKIFSLDNNVRANLLFACINHFHCPDYDEEILSRLEGLKTDNLEEQSMIEYVKSWSYYRLGMWSLYEHSLIKSIQLYPFNVWNYDDLGKFYIKHGKQKEGLELITKAIKNVREVFLDDYDYSKCDYSSIQEYFDELIRGTHITDVLYESLKKELLEVS